MPFTPAYLSEQSGNAIISDLQPTTIAPAALQQINLFLDEILVLLLTNSESLNPRDLRLHAIPAVFSSDKAESTGTRALGRSAVAEAEVELRSWYDASPSRKAYKGDGAGKGMIRGGAPFPVPQAAELLRVKGASYCVSDTLCVLEVSAEGETLAPEEPPSRAIEDAAIAAWRSAGGDTTEEIVEPAALWTTAVIEHVCEHIVAALSRVVARDSSLSIAGPTELYTTLCEDESIWGLFKKMKVKDSLEEVMRNQKASKRSNGASHISPTDKTTGRMTPLSGSPRIGSSTPPRDGGIDERASAERTRAGGIVNSGLKQSPSMTRRMLGRDKEAQPLGTHERSPSVLSVSTQRMIGAYQDSMGQGPRSPQEDLDDFDALMRSGETMKVSLTPSRLKTFDTTRKNQPGSPNQSSFNRDNTRPPLPAGPYEGSPQPHRNTSTNSIESPSRVPPRPGNRSRSSSTNKLAARGATTIEEHDEEENDAPGGRRGKKETLAEMFASEPGPAVPPASKRTAPAVVLGTPPPAAPSSSLQPPERTIDRRPSIPSLNRPQGRNISNDGIEHEDFANRPRRRTEAQELADFLSSTAPPPSGNPLTPPGSEAGKTKGLKGFMSKLAGGRKESQSKLPKVDDIPTINPALVAAKRQQTRNDSSTFSQTSSLNRLPSSSSAPSVEAAPAMPSKQPNNLRKRSDGYGAMPMVQSMPQKLSETEGAIPRAQARGNAGMGEKEVLAATGIAAGAAIATVAIASQAGDKAASHDAAAAVPKAATTDLVRSVPRPSASEVKNDSVPETAPIRDAQPPASTSQTALGQSTSDINSFMTADEGNRETSDQEAPAPIPNAIGLAAGIAPPPNTESTPSIPLSDLTALRTLLDHATSARECQLLLNAVLSQWGVPTSSDSPDQLTPEDRVAAWLLAGREGPVGIVTSPTTTSAFSKGEIEEIQTPTQSTPVAMFSSTLPAADGLPKIPMSSQRHPVESQVDGDGQNIMDDSDVELSHAQIRARKGMGRLMPGGLGNIGGQSTPVVAD